jgi:serpin B
VLSRRELIRVATVGGLVVAVPGLLVGCADGTSGPRRAAKPGEITLVSSVVGRATADLASIDAGTLSVVALGGGLYGELVGDTNLALSPLSAAVALGMSVNGALGTTRDEMLSVLAADGVDALDDGLNALTTYIESLAGRVRDSTGEQIALDSANQLFGQAGIHWETPFLDALAHSFGAGLREVDYVDATEQARAAINDWTADRTHDRIPEIVPAGAVDDSTRLVLVNALYFKAPWLEKFEEGATTDDEFHLGDGSTVSVPTMHGSAGLSEGYGWRAAHLAYANGTLAMTVVLPDPGREQELDDLVAGGGLAGLLTGDSVVELSLPRWKFTVSSALKEPLKALGMTTAFGASADFSAMTQQASLFISAVLQQVFIAVDEEGTEAAAATAVVVAGSAAVVPTTEPLVVDRPFVFVIHDVEHGTPLFLGKVVDPRG